MTPAMGRRAADTFVCCSNLTSLIACEYRYCAVMGTAEVIFALAPSCDGGQRVAGEYWCVADLGPVRVAVATDYGGLVEYLRDFYALEVRAEGMARPTG